MGIIWKLTWFEVMSPQRDKRWELQLVRDSPLYEKKKIEKSTNSTIWVSNIFLPFQTPCLQVFLWNDTFIKDDWPVTQNTTIILVWIDLAKH